MANQVAALATAAERLERLDSSVPVADEVGNAVLTDNRHIMRLAGPLFVLLSVLLVPWTVFIAVALVFLGVGLAATGYYALRRSRWLPVAAAATAAMLFVDAWFDVVTSPSGRDLVAAIVLAVFVELPLSALSLYLAREVQLVSDKRLAVLLTEDRSRSPRAATS